eukprot:13598153-Ditylum_brightwellii.AAC.1
MPVPEGGDTNVELPPLVRRDDNNIEDVDSDSKDDDVAVEPSPPCRYPCCTTRGRGPTLFHDFPYVTGIAEYVPVEAHNHAFLACLPSYKDVCSSQVDSQDLDGYVNAVHPLAFVAKANALDTPNYYQAMNRPDAPLFVKAMEEE